jgi:hypothetical protein
MRFVVAAVALSGCVVDVAHITAVRDVQDRFSELAREESRKSLEAVLPSAAPLGEAKAWGDPRGALEASASDAEWAELHRRYDEVWRLADALLKRAPDKLRDDGLLGTVASLRVLAFWRTTFYAHLLRAAAEPLTSVAAMAEQTIEALDRAKVELHPRDRFLLVAMRPLVRYDVAYVTAVDKHRRGLITAQAGSRDTVAPIAEAMARAEGELAALELPAHLERYVLVARLVMLRTASTLAHLCFNMTDPSTGAALPTLKARVAAFREEAGRDALAEELRIRADLDRLLRGIP